MVKRQPAGKEQVSQIGKRAVEERVRTTDHSDPCNREPAVFDKDAKLTVENAIYALYTIRRLAIRATSELPVACGDAANFCYAIKQMALLNGRDLDKCIERVSGSNTGRFDEDCIDVAETETEANHG